MAGDETPRPDDAPPLHDNGTDWVAVATEQELKRRRKLLVKVDGHTVALFWVDGQPYALQNTCIHKKRHLIKGTVLGSRIVCPGHQWAFELATGYEKSQDACQPTFAVRLDSGFVYLDPEPRIVVEDTSWEPGLNR